MIVYKDIFFCLQDCGRIECIRNKQNIPWDNQLPVSFMRCEDCKSWEKMRDTEAFGDYYIKEE